MTDPLYGRTAADGLCVLKDEWCQKSYLKEQCEHLSENLDQAIKATEASVPQRDKDLRLGKTATTEIDKTQRERLWERSMFLRRSDSGLSPVPNCWERLIAFQVPLFNEQEKFGCGYVDLLGVESSGCPVIIELKKEPKTSPAGITQSSETPLRMVLEAACYGIAIRVNWIPFRSEFVSRLESLKIPSRIYKRVPENLTRIHLVCAAPAAYWIDWLPITEKDQQVDPDAWRAFNRLLESLERSGIHVSFVSISGDLNNPDSLAVQPLVSFPVVNQIPVVNQKGQQMRDTQFRNWMNELNQPAGNRPELPLLLRSLLQEQLQLEQKVERRYAGKEILISRIEHEYQEAHGEKRAVYGLYHQSLKDNSGCFAIGDDMYWLLSYEVPNQEGYRMRRADLLGLSKTGGLVVFEAKLATNRYAPFASILEGLDYLACLTSEMNFVRLQEEFWILRDALEGIGRLPQSFTEVEPTREARHEVIVLAPQEYYGVFTRSRRGSGWKDLSESVQRDSDSIRLGFATSEVDTNGFYSQDANWCE